MSWNRLVLSAIVFFWANNAMAILPSAIQPNEFPVLPAYCKAKLSNDSSDDKAYSGMIGPDWRHIHHYCFALNFTNRFYKTSNPNEKKHYLSSALNNHDYMFTHATPDFWMRPEIHTEKAKQLKAANRYVESLGELKKALQIKPDYVSAYVVLADVYRELNKKSEAISTVEHGLQYEPENKPLQRRYKSLTGKAFVPPHVTPALRDDKEMVHTPSDAEIVDSEKNVDATDNKPALLQDELESSAPGAIGSPTNPYCRFCP